MNLSSPIAGALLIASAFNGIASAQEHSQFSSPESVTTTIVGTYQPGQSGYAASLAFLRGMIDSGRAYGKIYQQPARMEVRTQFHSGNPAFPGNGRHDSDFQRNPNTVTLRPPPDFDPPNPEPPVPYPTHPNGDPWGDGDTWGTNICSTHIYQEWEFEFVDDDGDGDGEWVQTSYSIEWVSDCSQSP